MPIISVTKAPGGTGLGPAPAAQQVDTTAHRILAERIEVDELGGVVLVEDPLEAELDGMIPAAT